MFKNIKLDDTLRQVRNRTRTSEEALLNETKRILSNDLFAESKILENLKQYNQSHELLDEEDVEQENLFTVSEIKQTAIVYRLKFLDSQELKSDIPYEAVLKIKSLNTFFHKDLKYFKCLSLPEALHKNESSMSTLLFVKTNHNNYYLIHQWGASINWGRKLRYWPLRNFETLVATLIFITLCITLILPTNLITLDSKAEYWSGYRAATFFHLLIFNLGVTAYITFAFAKNFSSSIWNSRKDFD